MKVLCLAAVAFVAVATVTAAEKTSQLFDSQENNQQWREQGNNNNQYLGKSNDQSLSYQGLNRNNNQGQNNMGLNKQMNDNIGLNGQMNRHVYRQLNQDGKTLFNGQQNQQTNGDYNNQNTGYGSDESSEFMTTGSNSQEDYVQTEGISQKDAAYVLGNNVAKKMMNFVAIAEKYANANGAIKCEHTEEHLALKQMTLPLPDHQYLNINENKIKGLNHGIVKNMRINTEENNVDVEYLFNNLVAEGNTKTNTGNNEPFNVKMNNANIRVSTELNNRNRNVAWTHSEQIQINTDSALSQKHQILNQNNAASKFIQHLKRSIENEMIENSYEGFVGCMRTEAQKTYNMPLGPENDMVIVNKRTGLKVSLVNTQNWNDIESKDTRKIKSVSVRQIESGNGFRVKVNIVMSKQPTWQSDILVNKQQQTANFKNVNFQANDIVATAVLENIIQINGDSRFNVADVQVKFNGLKFNIADNQDLAMDVQQNLHRMLENNMAVVLKQQLKQQHQFCQNSQDECAKCGNQKPSLLSSLFNKKV
ncbi:putative uncharacterized protein DDB_G0282133 [Adelges cooleyi]|uniref:putative uncharacterized protein DDB_G0282133 n=1 Tax=Adelges cooleyi TaxID=133065 RepID=UPI0021800C6F|nr:putative uncharacterized protein DDB_G0282133 [Adelges cooleyi]